MIWREAPVIVVGAGPVGQTTALLLARWGVPTIVLDQAPRRDRFASRAICQHRDVLDIWAAVGAGEQIAAEGLTWTLSRTFHRDRELFNQVFADPGRSPFPPFVNISQARTEEILDECIAAAPLVDVHWGWCVTAIDQDAAGVTVHCDTSAGSVELRAPYLVVCSGARSEQLRQSLGVRFDGHSFDDRFLICDIRAELPWASERRFHFDPDWNPGRQVLIHPCPDSTFRIDWQVPPDFDLAAETANGGLDRRIRAIIGDRGHEVVWSSMYRFHARCVDRMRAGRVLLAGDAAHLYAPFGARGLNSGVADAENAAWKIAYAGLGWAPGALLESYHDERHAAARENLEITAATMDFLVPPDEERARIRAEVLAGAADDPAVRARVDSGRLSEPFWYSDSPLTTASAERPFTGRPPRGQAPPAGPGVLLPDAPVALPEGRVRAVARDGFLLLATSGAEDVAARAAASNGAGPVRALALPAIDPDGALTAALDAHPGEVWVIRPDAHIAAVLVDPSQPEIATAVRRATG